MSIEICLVIYKRIHRLGVIFDCLHDQTMQYFKFGPGCILGWYTRKFTEERYWGNNTFNTYGVRVDYVGTGGMIMDRKIIDEEESLQNIHQDYAKVEDLYL